MTESQRKAWLQLVLERISEEEFFVAFGCDFRTNPDCTIQLLEKAHDDRSADDVECAFDIIHRFKPSSDYVPLLCKLLLADFHTRHEDIALALEALEDPRSIDALFRAANMTFSYCEWDENFALPRKCTWALARIGTTEAFERLKELAKSPNPRVAAFADKRLRSTQ